MAINFRFSYTRASLTYPKCDFDMKAYLDHCKSSFNLKEIIVCAEYHADGDEHRHAYLHFAQRPNFKNPKIFDYCNFHPNIQPTKNPIAWKQYCKKDGKFLEWINEIESTDESLEEACARCETIQTWMQYCFEHKVNATLMDRFWMLKGNLGTITEEEVILGTMDPRLHLINISDFEKPIVLVGPTGIGKVTKFI